MTVYSAFSIPTSGMMSQAHSLNNIGNNIANISTGGYKRTETNFSTVLSRTSYQQSDLGGVRPQDVSLISKQGNMVSSASDLDLAINGKGFFIFSTQFSGGTNVYGRDGSFEMRTVNDISVPGIGGSTLSSKDGYLVDKNGYFLQGWTAGADGSFASKTLSSLRIDQFAFQDFGTTTTSGKLDLNLPATDSPGFGQVDSILLGGTVEAGDIYSVTVSGTKVDYIVPTTGATLDSVRNGLVAAINADTTVAALVTASASPTTGTLLITGKATGDTLTTSASVTDAGTMDTTAVLNKVQSAIAGKAQFYNIEVIDLNNKPRSARMDFSKTDTNTWKLEATVPTVPVAQVDTISLAGTVEAGDIYTTTINGTTLTYTVLGSEGTIDGVRDAIVAAINANTSVNASVTAAAAGAGKMTLTSDSAGTAITTTVNTTNRTAVAQKETVTIATGSSQANDVYTTTVAGNIYTHTSLVPETETVIANALALQINGDPNVSAISAAGVITITALVPGTAFASAATVVTDFDLGGDALAATDLVTQANVVATADNTSTVAVTTANAGAGTDSTTVSTIVFDENGKLITPTSGTVSMTLNFLEQGSYAASSATMTLDISKISQFSGDFLPISYSHNGFAAADLRTISFNGSGEIVANFDNSTNRTVYKIPLAVFSNPNALASNNGNVYEETENSGTARVVAADDSGYATFLPNTHELSNVDMAGEFSRMIMTQTAYNSSATVFKTVDEMVMTARDLKR